MRVILFFDLPVEKAAQRRAYTQFRKNLLSEGFIMLQKSVYTKLALNMTSVELIKKRVKKKMPKDGLIQVLTITERQFASIENMLGESSSEQIDSMDRLLVI